METPTPNETAVIETPVNEQVPSNEATVFDPEKLPADIKSYVSGREAEITKKYADYDKLQTSAREWEGVRNDPRFQKWSQGLNAPETPKPFEISDDQFTGALSDKGKFLELVNQAAEKLLSEKIGPQLDQVRNQNDFQSKMSELSQVVAKYPDFKDLDKRGLIEPIIRRYPSNPAAGIPGISFEDAYKLAKHSTLGEEADKLARGIVNGKRAATVERPGSANGARNPKVNAKNREEAMNMVAEAVRNGRPVPEFDEIGG